MKRKNICCPNLPSIGFNHNTIIYLLLCTVPLLLQCSRSSTNDHTYKVRQLGKELKVTLEVRDSLTFGLGGQIQGGLIGSIDVFDSLVTVLEPFEGSMRIFDRSKRQLTHTIALRKVTKMGQSKRLVGGSAKKVVIRMDEIFVLEQSTPKVVQYDFDGTKVKTTDIAASFKLPMEEPGIFKATQEGIVWSFDDVFGRLFLGGGPQFEDEAGIIFRLEDEQVKVLLSAKTLKKAARMDTLPYLRAAQNGDRYFVTFTNQIDFHEFDQFGRYVSSDTTFRSLVNTEYLSQDELDQRAGVVKLLVSDEYYVLLVMIRNEKDQPLNYEILGINRESGDYWKRSFPGDWEVQPIRLENDRLTYWVSDKADEAVVYFTQIKPNNIY